MSKNRILLIVALIVVVLVVLGIAHKGEKRNADQDLIDAATGDVLEVENLPEDDFSDVLDSEEIPDGSFDSSDTTSSGDNAGETTQPPALTPSKEASIDDALSSLDELFATDDIDDSGVAATINSDTSGSLFTEYNF